MTLVGTRKFRARSRELDREPSGNAREPPDESPRRYAGLVELEPRLRELGIASGLEAIGFASAAPFEDVAESLKERVAGGLNGRLAFTYARPEVSTDVSLTFPWATSLVVCARSYLPEAGSPQSGSGLGRIARFAVDDPYGPLRAAMDPVASALRAAGGRAELLIDDNRLVDRAAAVRAGIAWWGKNTMALTPAAGPWLVLGSIVTDLELAPDQPMRRDCGTCQACLPACPTGALIEPGVLDARRCLAAIAQAPGWIPGEFRQAMGDRIYGCDDCLDACPPGSQRLATATESRGAVDLIALLAMDEAEITAAYNRFYFPKNDPNSLKRNALVALGNTGGAEHVAAVAACLVHRKPGIRAHAAWALGRLGGREATVALRDSLAGEREPDVRAEIEAALAVLDEA